MGSEFESNGFSHHDADGSELIKNGPEGHFETMKSWYEYANEFAVAKVARAGYETAKHSCSLAENTLNKVETGLQSGLTNVAAPAYANYLYPATDRLLQYYTKSKYLSFIFFVNIFSLLIALHITFRFRLGYHQMCC